MNTRSILEAAGIVTLSLTLGCTIIINPKTGDDGQTPIPVPLTCTPVAVAPTVHIIFSTRIERTTVNVADHFAGFMVNTTLAMAGAGLQPTQAVLLRADERPVENEVLGAWGCTLDSIDDLPPSDVIRYYAIEEDLDASPLSCATDTLLSSGAALGDLVTRYPPELNGKSSTRIFGGAPDIVLVVHMDALERRTGATDAACSNIQRFAERSPDGSAAWLKYVDGGVPMERIVHWFVTTEEGMDRRTFVDQCRRYEGFPTDVLDVLEPSPVALYTPLMDAITKSGSSAGHFSMCAMLSGNAEFFTSQAKIIGGLVGLDVDEDKVLETIQNGGVPTEIPMLEGSGRLEVPGG